MSFGELLGAARSAVGAADINVIGGGDGGARTGATDGDRAEASVDVPVAAGQGNGTGDEGTERVIPEVPEEATSDAATPAPDRGTEAPGALPRTRFAAAGASTVVRQLPAPLVVALREAVAEAVARTRAGDGVTPEQAAGWAQGLSQGALVVGLCLSRLDVDVEVDETTGLVADALRAHDPAQGVVLNRLVALADQAAATERRLDRIDRRTRSLASAVGTVEHGVAYFLADHVANFQHGQHDARNLPFGNDLVTVVRDRLRDYAGRQSRNDADREGRPIR